MWEHEAAATRRKKSVKRYFERTPDPREGRRALNVLALSAAVLLTAAALGILGTGLLRLAAVLPLLPGLVLLLRGLELKSSYDRRLHAAEPKPSEAELEEFLQQDLDNIRNRAMDRLDVTYDEVQLRESPRDVVALTDEPEIPDDTTALVVHGPADDRDAVRLADGHLRCRSYEVMVICPTDRHLAVYLCGLDFLTGGVTYEVTSEFHYVDVVAVGTATRSAEEPSSRLRDRASKDDVHFATKLVRRFEITVASGDAVGIPVDVLDKDHPGNTGKDQRVDIDQVVKYVRKVLREKKSTPGTGTLAPAPGTPRRRVPAG